MKPIVPSATLPSSSSSLPHSSSSSLPHSSSPSSLPRSSSPSLPSISCPSFSIPSSSTPLKHHSKRAKQSVSSSSSSPSLVPNPAHLILPPCIHPSLLHAARVLTSKAALDLYSELTEAGFIPVDVLRGISHCLEKGEPASFDSVTLVILSSLSNVTI